MISKIPEATGVPLSTPVVEFRVNHEGSVLELNVFALLLAEIV